MLEKHIFKPRKHMLKRHLAAAIYASCKLHNIQITACDIVENLELTGKHLSTFFLKFHKLCHNHQDPLKTETTPSQPIELADLKDLERNDVIPPNSAQTFYKFCSDLSDLFPVTEHCYSRPSSCGRHSGYFRRDARHRLAVFLSMAHLHLYGEQLDSSKFGSVGVPSHRVKSFEKDVRLSWNMLHKTCLLFMSWILCRSRNCSIKEFPKLLGKLLERKAKSLLLENLRKYREFGDVRRAKIKERSHQKARRKYTRHEKYPSGNAPQTTSSPQLQTQWPPHPNTTTGTEESAVIDTLTLNQCLDVFNQHIPLQHTDGIVRLFERLLMILYLTDMRSLLQRIPKLIYFVLLHQIIITTEPSVPPLSQLLNEKNKSDKVDEMIRKMFIKTFVKYTPEMLPTNLDLRKLTDSIHTFYSAIVNPAQSYKKLINNISAETVSEPSPSSSSVSSPRSDIQFVVPPELTAALLSHLQD